MSEQQTQSSGATVVATAERKIKVISTRGEKKDVIFKGSKWSELKPVLQKEGYDLGNVKAVEGINKTTLEHPDAVVPEGNFNLFLMQQKSKSGGKELSRGDLYIKIKKLVSNKDSGEKAKSHFGNYTQKKTTELQELLNSFNPEGKKEAAKEKSKAKARAVKDVVDAVKNSETEEEAMEHLEGLSVDEKLNIVIKVLVRSGVLKGHKDTETSGEVVEEKETDEERRKREEREAQEKEDEKLDEEMDQLMSGFDDVDKSKSPKRRRGY